MLDPKADGIVAIDPFTRPKQPLDVELVVGKLSMGRQLLLSPRARRLLLQLPDRLPMHLDSLHKEVQRALPAQARDHDTAAHFESWLADNRRYALPGTEGSVRNLGEFLLGSAGGHCEYFATTLALLLRMHGIPCRVVGGYLAHEWDGDKNEMLVRQRDAHAWGRGAPARCRLDHPGCHSARKPGA